MLDPKSLQFLGLLGVDSGRVAIVDPCNALIIADAEQRRPGSSSDVDFDFATVVPTLHGDGLFEVFGVYGEDGRATGIYVDFDGRYSDVDVSDDPAPAEAAG
ncbi:hypothetical protein [Streptomyces wuyuanensis]|uniref:hypothetical protein n=1 Tax=Streptomyces wuyuanensis TaxID=1196353 RepID=UPI00341C3C52